MFADEKYLRKATGLNVRVVRSCRSTFDEIADNDVIIAGSQKCGAGRGDHTFFSPSGGLYIVMRETGLNIDQRTLTPAVGIAVRDSIRAVIGADTRLKWVNDVMLDTKKVAGILVRSPRRGEYLIGMGINYATDEHDFIKAGLACAGSLHAPVEKTNVFLYDLIKRVHNTAISTFDCARYNALCTTVGKTVSFTKNGIKVQGYAESVQPDGALIVRIGAATVAVDSGEVFELRQE